MKDVLTDLNAEGEVLPLSPPREDWFGHKGMVQTAEYIRKKLQEEDIIARARAKVRRAMSRASLRSLSERSKWTIPPEVVIATSLVVW